MNQLLIQSEPKSKSRIIASSGVFQIELLDHVSQDDYPTLIEISKHLKSQYGEKAVLTKTTIQKYFNKSGSLPFIARYREEIIGFIIGVPLEELSQEPWALLDKNFGKGNTLYTYAFIIMAQFKNNGYAKMLKRVYLSWAKKRMIFRFVTGHVKLGVSSRFSGEIKIVNRVDNWRETGEIFEYYRRNLQPNEFSLQKNNPPLAEKV